MTDRQRILAEINEMAGFAGAALSVRTLVVLIHQYLERIGEETVTIAEVQEYLDEIALKAREMANDPSQWTDERGRVAVVANSNVQDSADRILVKLNEMLIRLDTAYGQNFHLEGAIDYLRQVASNAELLKKEMGK